MDACTASASTEAQGAGASLTHIVPSPPMSAALSPTHPRLPSLPLSPLPFVLQRAGIFFGRPLCFIVSARLIVSGKSGSALSGMGERGLGVSDADWRFERRPEAVCSAKALGGWGRFRSTLPSLIVPAGQEQNTVLSYSNNFL